MYIPREFNASDQAELLDFITANPLGMLVTGSGNSELQACHLPFLARKTEKEELILEGHIALANPQVAELKNGSKVLVVFQGPDAYISSSLYSHTNVPTWNYQAVHIYGTAEALSEEELKRHLAESVAWFEAQRHRKVSYHDFPEAMLEAYLKEILGVRIRAYRLEGAFKLSQNRNHKDYENIVRDLTASPHPGDREMGHIMAGRVPKDKER